VLIAEQLEIYVFLDGYTNWHNIFGKVFDSVST
jgi:hypothetical protein